MIPEFHPKSVEELKTHLGENISNLCGFEEERVVNITFEPEKMHPSSLRELEKKVRTMGRARRIIPGKIQVVLTSEKKQISLVELEKHRSRIRPLTLKRLCFIHQEISKKGEKVSPRLVQEMLCCSLQTAYDYYHTYFFLIMQSGR